MPNEGHVYLKNKGVRDYLENVAWAWRAKYPKRAARYKQLLAEEKKALVNPTGMSKDGNLKYTGMIPQDVFIVIERKHVNFFKNPNNMRIFQEIFMKTYAPDKVEKKVF